MTTPNAGSSLLTILLASLLAPRAFAYTADPAEVLSPNPDDYRQYFNLEKGETLATKVRHLGDRIRDDKDDDKSDKSIVGIRQALNDLFTSIERRQLGIPDSEQSKMLGTSLPGEKALAVLI